MSGKASVGPELSGVWAAATGGVVLVSATLWLPNWQKTERVNYMREVLHLPLDRMDTPSSVVWDEVFKAPTLFLPDKNIAPDLIPPDDSSDDKLQSWCEAQARRIAAFNKDCTGGTLVLCTSYVQIKALKEKLLARGIKESRIVENSGRLVDDQAKFTELHKDNKRPLWLALGPAWTGVDLVEKNQGGRDVPAGRDTLLTDLIITRLPIGLNRTLTMESRLAWDFTVLGSEALLRLKQGMGRLIRRSGLKNRRILVLDGRMTCDPALNTRFIQQVVAGAHALLESYKTRKALWKG